MVCPVRVTMKTHKSVPEVRTLHASAKSSFEGFSRILHRWLSEVLTGVWHLVPNTASLLKEIRRHRFLAD